MANFDFAVGLTETSTNALVKQFFNNPPSAHDPFQGSVNKTVPPFGELALTWKVEVSPVLTFTAPSPAEWDASLDSKGETNKSAGNPIPSGNIIQLAVPKMKANYSSQKISPVGGETSNLVVYATIAFPAGEIVVTPVAILLNEDDFKEWDKAIFNNFLIPKLFSAAASMLSVVHIPNLSWDGITLNTPQLFLIKSLLVAAATQKGNSDSLDVNGYVWPTKGMFILGSKSLINSALADFCKQEEGKKFNKSGDWNKLADYDVSLIINSIIASLKTINPLSVTATVGVSVVAGGKLTAAGMALAAVGCALGAAAIVL